MFCLQCTVGICVTVWHGRRQDSCCVGAAWGRAKGIGVQNRAYALGASSYMGGAGTGAAAPPPLAPPIIPCCAGGYVYVV